MSDSFDPQSTNTQNTEFRKIVSGAGILTIARVAGDMASALLFVTISRIHGVESVGLYAYAFAIAQIAQQVVNYGFEDYGLREFARAGEPKRSAFLGNVLGLQSMLLVVVLLGVAVFVGLTGAEGTAATLIWSFVLYQILINFSLMFMIPPITAQRVGPSALAELVFRVGGAVMAAAILAFTSLALETALLALPLSALGLVIVNRRIASRHVENLRPRFDFYVIARFLPPATVFALSSMVTNLLGRIGLILLVVLQGESAGGILAAGNKLLELAIAPLFYLGIAVFPRLSRSFGSDMADLAATAEQYLRLTVMMGFLILWGMTFVVPPLMPVILGSDFSEAGSVIRLMGWVALLVALDQATFRLLWAADRQGLRLRIQIMGLVINVVAAVTLIPPFGVTGAVLAFMIALVAMLVASVAGISRHLPSLAWMAIVRASALPIGASVLCGAVVAALGKSLWVSGGATLAVLLISALVSGLLDLGQFKRVPRLRRWPRHSRRSGDG